MAGRAEATEESIDCFVRSHADEEIRRRQCLIRVRVGGAQVTEELFEVLLMALSQTISRDSPALPDIGVYDRNEAQDWKFHLPW